MKKYSGKSLPRAKAGVAPWITLRHIRPIRLAGEQWPKGREVIEFATWRRLTRLERLTAGAHYMLDNEHFTVLRAMGGDVFSRQVVELRLLGFVAGDVRPDMSERDIRAVIKRGLDLMSRPAFAVAYMRMNPEVVETIKRRILELAEVHFPEHYNELRANPAFAIGGPL